jgi:Tfp pilus assembly PilM family ATPase
MIVEHLILGNAEDENPPQIYVLLVGVPRKLIYQIYETFSKAGLDLLAVEIEPLSLWRSIGTQTTIRQDSPIIRDESFIGLDIEPKLQTWLFFRGRN